MTRAALVATALAIAAALAAAALAAPQEPRKPPKPKLELRTETQAAALRREAIELDAFSRRGKRVRVEARLTVEGIPEDYRFRLGPERERLRAKRADVNLRLSPRQQEVLAFAAQACMGARVNAKARAAGRTGRLRAPLRKDC